MILVRLDYQVHISETQLRVLNSKHHVQRLVCCRFKANCPLVGPGPRGSALRRCLSKGSVQRSELP